MSTFETLQARRTELLNIAQRYGAYNVRVFGSVTRGEDTSGSDIDFLIDMESGRSLLDLVGLQQALSRLLGRRVDILTERSLNRNLRTRILGEALRL